MNKVILIWLSALFCVTLFLIIKTGKEMNGDVQIKGDSYLEDIEILHRKNGQTVWSLTAKTADFKDNQNKAQLNNITLKIKQNEITLYTDKGLYDLSKQSFTTEDVIRAEGNDFTISADSLNYEISSGKIKTDGMIKLTGKGFIVEGKGMQAEAEKKVDILNDVKATFQK